MQTNNPAGHYFAAELDLMASHLQTLQSAGVIVLFRPFHEMNGGWFWWGAQSDTSPSVAEFVELWRYVHDYVVKQKQLTNILWVYSPENSETVNVNYPWGLLKPTAFFYPGDSYVDVIGIDYYIIILNHLPWMKMRAIDQSQHIINWSGSENQSDLRNSAQVTLNIEITISPPR